MDRLKVLVVDDTPSAVQLLIDTLSTEQYNVLTATTGPECLEVASRETPDVILLDVMLPGMSGFDVCQQLREQPTLSDITIIMLTALDDRRARISAFSAGADDFLTKPFDRVELRLRLRGIARLNRFRRLLEQHRAYEDLARLSPDGILSLDGDGRILFGNPSSSAMVGVVGGRPFASLFHHDDQSRVEDYRAQVMSGREVSHRFTARLIDEAGRIVHTECTLGRVAIITGPQRASVVMRDVSAQQAIETQIDKFERAELVAAASAEVAHDVSNFLLIAQTALFHVGHAIGDEHAAHGDLATAGDMVERAGNLLHSLARFDRVSHNTTRVELNAELRDTEPMLALLAEGTALSLELEPGPLWVSMPSAELHQVLSNLVANARDAAPEGSGLIRVRTSSSHDDSLDARGDRASQWHFIEVIDNGSGMSDEVVRQAFDQYFTTKGDAGTGLGLPSVHRIVSRHGGTIRIDSRVGVGSTFTIGFPAVQPDAVPSEVSTT